MKVKYFAALAAASVFGLTGLTSCAGDTTTETPAEEAMEAEGEALEEEGEAMMEKGEEMQEEANDPCAAVDPCAAE